MGQLLFQEAFANVIKRVVYKGLWCSEK